MMEGWMDGAGLTSNGFCELKTFHCCIKNLESRKDIETRKTLREHRPPARQVITHNIYIRF